MSADSQETNDSRISEGWVRIGFPLDSSYLEASAVSGLIKVRVEISYLGIMTFIPSMYFVVLHSVDGNRS